MGIYDNVKTACKNKGISINKLEQTLGFARSSISKFNTNIPSIEKMSQIAKELGVTVDYLMTGKESDKEENKNKELKGVYFNFAKEMQEKNISEDDMQRLWDFYEMIQNARK